jgi:hypothetical protein
MLRLFFAPVAALDRFALLVRGQLRWASHLHSTSHGARSPFSGASSYQIAFELSKPAK